MVSDIKELYRDPVVQVIMELSFDCPVAHYQSLVSSILGHLPLTSSVTINTNEVSE